MLVIEHDMPLIMGISDRVYCLELGRVIAEGAPDDGAQRPGGRSPATSAPTSGPSPAAAPVADVADVETVVLGEV